MNQAGFGDNPYRDGNRDSDDSRLVTDKENVKTPVAHLDIMSGWRLWITIAWYVENTAKSS